MGGGPAGGRDDADPAVSSSVAEASGLSPQESLARQRRIFVDDVVAVRRAIDLLRARPEVDPNRIGLVGWSLGARVGAVTAGADPRLKAVVLMSGGASPVSTYVAQAPAALRPQVRPVLTALDPLRWIARAQGAGHAPGRPQGRGRPAGGARRASEGGAAGARWSSWYPTGHELNAQAYVDQLAFLAEEAPDRRPEDPGRPDRAVVYSTLGGWQKPAGSGRSSPCSSPTWSASLSRAEQIDPEDVAAELGRYQGHLRGELERRGGTVEKFIGDAVMAVFGAPAAHEDDPERAIRAALAIREWAEDEASRCGSE